MDILIVTSEIGNNAGGLALTCSQLKNILEELGHTVFIETSLASMDKLTVDGGYDQKLANKLIFSHNIKELSKKHQGIDIIIAYGAEKNSYTASLLAKKLNKKLIVVLCGSDINMALGSIESYHYNFHSLKSAKIVVGLSEELIGNSKLIFEKEESTYKVIPNIYEANKDITYKELDCKCVKFALGSAFLNEKKGVSNFIRAFGRYCKDFKRTSDKLYLSGEIDYDLKKKYQDIIVETNMENNIYLQGRLNRKEYLSSLEDIDVYVQPSFFEGCCNSVGEAILEGKFILLSDTGYFSEILKEEFPEIIMDDLSREKIPLLLNSYVDFIQKKDFREKITEITKQTFNKEKVLKSWEEVLTHISEKRIIKETCAVMFHDVENSYTGLDYHRKGFRKLVELIYSKGYKLCSYKEYEESYDKSNLIICTFDDAYEGVYYNAFPVLKEYNFTATVFVCPDLIEKDNDWNRRDIIIRHHMDMDMLLSLKEHSWEIGSHGLGHYNLLRLSQTDLEKNLENSKKTLEEMFGEITCFCYPFGDFNTYVKGIVKKYYNFAFSVDTGGSHYKKDRYQFVRMVPEELKKIMEEA